MAASAEDMEEADVVSTMAVLRVQKVPPNYAKDTVEAIGAHTRAVRTAHSPPQFFAQSTGEASDVLTVTVLKVQLAPPTSA